MTLRGIGGAAPSERVLQSIASASQRTGISFGYLLNQARTESSFNPTAKASTSSARGLFQFTNQTWLSTVRAHGAAHGIGWAANAIQRAPNGHHYVADPGLKQQVLDLRLDPSASSAMAGEFAADNGDFLSKRLGRSVDETDLSIAHFLGGGGALKFLTALAQSPDASAAPYFPEAAGANPTIFFASSGNPRSFAEIRDRFAHKASAPPASTSVRNVAQAMPSIQVVRREASSSSTATEGAARWADRMASIDPMPTRLSLSFAQDAYRKLASLGGDQ